MAARVFAEAQLGILKSVPDKGFLLLVWNGLSTFCIIYFNKLLYNAGFKSVCVLTAIHQLATTFGASLFSKIASGNSTYSKTKADRRTKLTYAFFFNASVVCMNFSLLHNTVVRYQIFKLMILPVVAFLQVIVFSQENSTVQYFAVVLVIIGSFTVVFVDANSKTVHQTDVNAKPSMRMLGMVSGILAVLTSSVQVVYLKYLQRKYLETGNLLRALSLYSAVLGGLTAPALDSYLAGVGFLSFVRSFFGIAHLSTESLSYLTLSVFFAVSVNVSQFLVINRFSALAFQVLGQVKMIGLVLLGCAVFNEKMEPVKVIGICCGIFGSWLYTSKIKFKSLFHSTRGPASAAVAVVLLVCGIYFTLHARSGPVFEISSVSQHPVKIFVYPIPEDLLMGTIDRSKYKPWEFCGGDPGYGLELQIGELLADSIFITSNYREARAFYIPMYLSCQMHTFMFGAGGNITNIDANVAKTFREYAKPIFNHVQRSFPHYNASGGLDHFIPVTHECIYAYLSEVLEFNTMIFVTPHGLAPGTLLDFGRICGRQSYHPTQPKDIVITPFATYEPLAMSKGQFMSLWGSKTKLAYFRGSLHLEDLRYSLGVRQLGLQLFGERSDFVYGVKIGNQKAYLEEMATSKFCLSMFGWVPWSGRLAHLLKEGCIPVIVADGIVLPFEDVVDWKSFTVKVAHNNFFLLPDILGNITVSQAWEMFQSLLLAREQLLYNKTSSVGALRTLVLSLSRRVPSRSLSAFDSLPTNLG